MPMLGFSVLRVLLKRFGYGAFGSQYYQGTDGVEVELPIPADAADVQYHMVIDQGSLAPAWAEDIPTEALPPYGVVCEWGDGVTPGGVVALQTARGRVVAGPGGVTIDALYLDADANCTVEVDILLNGVSIFGAGSTKPFLTAGMSYSDTAFAGTVDRDLVNGDLLTAKILSISGAAPTQLALTIEWE